MSSSAMGALKTALERREFDRVYLFHGDDDFLKEEKVRALIERATNLATRDFNLDVHRAGELDAESLIVALSALPMMAARRVVVIREATTLKKEARMALSTYLEHPAVDVVLVLVAGAGTKPDAALLARTSAIEFKPLNGDVLDSWLSHHLATLGVSIEPHAAELLRRATGNDLALLAGEIEKLRSYTPGSVIDEAAVTAVVGVRQGETLGDLLDLLAVRNGSGAIVLLERVLAQPKTTGVLVLMALTTQTLAIGWALAARARGLPQHQLEGELFGLLKQNPSSLVGRSWGDGVRSWVRALRYWDDASVDRMLELLAAADAALKDTRVSGEEQVLTTLVLAMTVGTPRRVAA